MGQIEEEDMEINHYVEMLFVMWRKRRQVKTEALFSSETVI
jgi:hypothetical protein